MWQTDGTSLERCTAHGDVCNARTRIYRGGAQRARVSATFSQPMTPSSITAVSFTLTAAGGAAVAGAVTYAASGSVRRLLLAQT